MARDQNKRSTFREYLMKRRRRFWSARHDVFGHPALRPFGAGLWPFKIVPDNFVERNHSDYVAL